MTGVGRGRKGSAVFAGTRVGTLSLRSRLGPLQIEVTGRRAECSASSHLGSVSCLVRGDVPAEQRHRLELHCARLLSLLSRAGLQCELQPSGRRGDHISEGVGHFWPDENCLAGADSGARGLDGVVLRTAEDGEAGGVRVVVGMGRSREPWSGSRDGVDD